MLGEFSGFLEKFHRSRVPAGLVFNEPAFPFDLHLQIAIRLGGEQSFGLFQRGLGLGVALQFPMHHGDLDE